MRSQIIDAASCRTFLHDTPNDIRRQLTSPDPPVLANTTEQPSILYSRRANPTLDRVLDPLRHWNAPNPSALADEIDDHTVFLSTLEVREVKSNHF
jgi:hypothetical protein